MISLILQRLELLQLMICTSSSCCDHVFTFSLSAHWKRPITSSHELIIISKQASSISCKLAATGTPCMQQQPARFDLSLSLDPSFATRSPACISLPVLEQQHHLPDICRNVQ
jgi:hypothetical protein